MLPASSTRPSKGYELVGSPLSLSFLHPSFASFPYFLMQGELVTEPVDGAAVDLIAYTEVDSAAGTITAQFLSPINCASTQTSFHLLVATA